MTPIIVNAALYWSDVVFYWNIRFKVGHRLYLRNQLGELKKLYIVIDDFGGKLYLSMVSFLFTVLYYIFTLFLALYCLKLSFSSRIISKCFWKTLLQLNIILNYRWMNLNFPFS